MHDESPPDLTGCVWSVFVGLICWMTFLIFAGMVLE